MQRLLLLIFIFCAQLAFAQVYKTVDKDGNVRYSDSPPSEQSESIKLPNINTLPADLQGQSYNNSSTVNEEVSGYQVEIISPRNEVVIPPGQRDLAVAVSVTPMLQSDHLVTYYLDDELVEETQATSIVIQNPPRGGRTLRVEVIDQTGEVLGQSEARTITIIRPTNRNKKN
jgi:hypothetical protein